jgi:hypothetical protein
MPNYEKTIIYKIQHREKPELLYVGCTTNYNGRKNQHKSRCNNPKDIEHEAYKYRMIRENGGWDAFEMHPVKQISCKDKLEAHIEEERVRQELKATLNVCTLPEKKRPAKPFLAMKTKQYTIADLVDV